MALQLKRGNKFHLQIKNLKKKRRMKNMTMSKFDHF